MFMTLLSLPLWTAPALASPIPVAFPDPNLEAVIREAIGKSSEDIYTTELEGLGSLDCSGRDITDITGLEYCTGLTKLWLRNNQISNIEPLVLNAGISAGDTVNLYSNPLSTTSLNSYIPQLEARGVNVLYTLPSYISFTITPAEPAIADNILARQTVSPASSTTVESKDGQIVIEFPAGSVVDDTVVTITEESPDGIPSCPAGFKAGTTCFSIDLTADLVDGTMVTITIKYSTADLEAAGNDPSKLTLSRYDENIDEWVILPTTVDTESMTLTASTSQFSTWLVMANEPADAIPFWVWLITAVGGLVTLLAVSSLFIRSRRR